MFSNYFPFSKNKIIFVVNLLFSSAFFFQFAPLYSMDMEIESDEEMPLMPQRITMNNVESQFFCGDRRFYDQESYQKNRNAAIKKCLCTTAIQTASCGCLGALLSIPLIGILAGLGITKGMWLTGTCSLVKESAILCSCGMCTIGCPVMGITEGCQSFSTIVDDPNQVTWKTMLEITPEMIDAADNQKQIVFKKIDLLTLLDRASAKSCSSRDDYPWPWLGKLISGYYRDEKKIIEQVKIRVGAEQSDEATLSEKELLYVMRDLTNYDHENPPHPIVKAYAHQSLLAANGWIAFQQSEKYPLKCEMKYCDQRTIPENAKQWYCNEHGQKVYLPIPHERMIRYYKFGEDPDYQHE